MINEERLTRWYNFQAPFYHFWRDSYGSDVIKIISHDLFVGRAPKLILDVGCGSGWLTVGLGACEPNCCFVGIDPSIGLLTIARKESVKRDLKNLHFSEGSVYELQFADSTFDVVTSGGLFPNINDHTAAITEMKRVLKPGGTLVVVEYDRATMTQLSRLFYNTMVFGYHVISRLFPRFRFAADWTLETGTVNRSELLSKFSAAGFRVKRDHAADHQMIFILEATSS
jgi:demethylmenaquinone methyltransferase / 2-methoxy-6-polyprenyl-1,4-benzoquinol methylase